MNFFFCSHSPLGNFSVDKSQLILNKWETTEQKNWKWIRHCYLGNKWEISFLKNESQSIFRFAVSGFFPVDTPKTLHFIQASFHWKCARRLRWLACRAWMKNETGNAHCRMPMLWNSWKGGESGRLKVSGRMEVLVSSILVMCTRARGPWNDWKQTR